MKHLTAVLACVVCIVGLAGAVDYRVKWQPGGLKCYCPRELAFKDEKRFSNWISTASRECKMGMVFYRIEATCPKCKPCPDIEIRKSNAPIFISTEPVHFSGKYEIKVDTGVIPPNLLPNKKGGRP